MKSSVVAIRAVTIIFLTAFPNDAFPVERMYGRFLTLHSSLCSDLLTQLWTDSPGAFFSEEARPFLEEIRANPQSDPARLRLADWLEQKGESLTTQFIRLEIEQARLEAVNKSARSPTFDQDLDRVRNAIQGLFRGDQDNINSLTILGPLARIDAAEFETKRGMVKSIGGYLANVLNHESDLLRFAPALTSFSFHRGSHSDFIRFLNSRLIPTASLLSFESCNIGQEGLTRFTSGDALPKLRRLFFRKDNLGDAGLTALAGSTRFSNVEEIMFDNANITVEGVEKILRSPNFPNLKSLVVTQLGPPIPIENGTVRKQVFTKDVFNRLNQIRPGVEVY